jgi:Zn-finger nucleic acid-binding protein
MSDLQCPACSHPLSRKYLGSIEVDVCHGGCGGIWFDAFELGQLDQYWSTEPREMRVPLVNPERLMAANPMRHCPRCDQIKLRRHFHNASRLVQVDSCPGCAGVWLDAGEFQRIRELRQAVRRPSSPSS